MSTEKWIAGSGVGLTWTSGFTSSTLNSIASGNAILSDVDIDNSSAFDTFCDVSIHLASAAFVSPNNIGIYIYPLDDDGTTYGDGRFGSSAAGPPPGNYLAGNIGIVAATQAQNGVYWGIPILPGHFKFVLYNQGGVALASSGNTLKYRTYNRSTG